MRRTVPALLLWSLLAASAVVAAPAVPVGAQAADPLAPAADLPAGFTDGEPVGGVELPAADAAAPTPTSGGGATTSSNGAATRASATRYFGQGPWDAIEAASAATPRCSNLSASGLTALIVAPIFKESSAATTPSSAPSPMTLSRWDEWNGTYATTSNASANHTLYAFRQPTTAYPRAYWHPGIGIWQYDSAGVGAPYTAIERMDVRVVAADVARGMASRYCNPPTAVVGHGAPFTDQERRDAAWWPWWTGNQNRSCPLCQAEFDRMTGDGPRFSNISLVAGISATGGAVRRSCSLAGVAGTVECWYVDPSVGVIQGATAWATLAPDGRGSPTVAPAPLARPFYVIKRNGLEERHWLRADTGYGIDISGTRRLGQPERVRSSHPLSGVTWASSSGLCDRTTGRGACSTTPPPPPPPTTPVPAPSGTNLRSTPVTVNGTYEPISLDANGDGRGDVLWYAPGAAADSLWLGQGSGGFRGVPVNIGGPFDDVLVLDADGDGRDDVLFHRKANGLAYLWRSRGDGTFTSTTYRPGAGKVPLVLDADGRGGDEIFWYGPGALGDSMWTWRTDVGGYSGRSTPVGGAYEPFVGDFDQNGTEDIFWYGPGSALDHLWLHRGAGGYVSKQIPVGGPYRPVVGDFDGSGSDDVLWYGAGSRVDTVWFFGPGGAYSSQTLVVTDAYDPLVVDLDDDGRDDVIWHAAGTGGDLWTRWGSSRARNSVSLSLTGPQRGVVGAFSGSGRDGVLWYGAGTAPDAVWWR